MKIDDSIDWNDDRSVVFEYGRGNNGGVESGIGDEVGRGGG